MTVIKKVSEKLLTLLDDKEFRDSIKVISSFKKSFKKDWELLVKNFGESSDIPGKGPRKKYYSAEVYIADRLSDLHKTGRIDREFIKNSDANFKKLIGNWRIKENPVILTKTLISTRIPKESLVKLTKIASAKKISVSHFFSEIIKNYLSN